MTLQEGISILLYGLLAVAAWAGVIFVIPWVQRGRFRLRLWRIRDRLTDDLISGALPINHSTERLRTSVDICIRYARDFTLANFALVYLVAHKRSLLQEPLLLTEGLNDEQLARVKEYSHELQKEQVVHLLTGSVSGWLGSIILGIVAIPRILTGEAAPKEVAEKVPSEVAGQPELWISGGRRRGKDSHELPLSVFV